MNPYFGKIEELTLQNTNFRQVLFTGQYSQLVLMSLKPGEEIGSEVHETVDQFFRFEKGQGKVVVGEGEEHPVGDGDAVVIPAGTKHNVINTSQTEELKLYTVYSPPNHPDGTLHATKAEADAYEKAEHGETQTPSVEAMSGGPAPNPTVASPNPAAAPTATSEPVVDLSNLEKEMKERSTPPSPGPATTDQAQTQTAPNPSPAVDSENKRA